MCRCGCAASSVLPRATAVPLWQSESSVTTYNVFEIWAITRNGSTENTWILGEKIFTVWFFVSGHSSHSSSFVNCYLLGRTWVRGRYGRDQNAETRRLVL